MNLRDFCKSFMSGMFFPAVFFTVVYTFMYLFGIGNIADLPVQFMAMYVPFLFGLMNVVYTSTKDKWPVQNNDNQLWAAGGLLGLIVGLVGVFCLNIPTLLFGFSGAMVYLPIILLPIIYGAIFRYIIGWLNSIWDVMPAMDTHQDRFE